MADKFGKWQIKNYPGRYNEDMAGKIKMWHVNHLNGR
jgi:hypothetical protein